MILYHWAQRKHLSSILEKGLFPKMGIVYLTPIINPEKLTAFVDSETDILLKVETKDLKLTSFDDCSDWEVLCWGHILPENIEVLDYKTYRKNKKEEILHQKYTKEHKEKVIIKIERNKYLTNENSKNKD